jgi:hypothetical protein
MNSRVFIPIFWFCFFTGCKNMNSTDEGKPLVKVGDKILYSSVVEQLLPEGASKEDSTAIVQGYIENWIRDNLIIMEAEKNIPNDLNLNKLVDDYRSSLLMYHYENKIIKTELDTIITASQKKDFYTEYGAQFLLSHAIVKAIIVLDKSKDKSFNKWSAKAKQLDENEILATANKNKYKILNNGSIWIPKDDLKNYVADISLSACKKGYSGSFSGKEGNIFILITGYYNEKEIPPLDYIDDKVEQVMLNNRKTLLLKAVRENLYKTNIAKRNIKFY